MKSFYQLLGNTLIAGVTNFFVWFALTYWAYLETRSVITTSVMAGIYLVLTALSGFWFGSIVDHNKKKTAILLSSLATLVFFIIGFFIYIVTPKEIFTNVLSPQLWILIIVLLVGSLVGNIRNITLPTVVTILVPENMRDRANGMSGTIMGISFAIVSVASGIVLARAGMFWVLAISVILTVLSIVHLLFIKIPEKQIVHSEENKKGIDLKGTFRVVKGIPGLFGLIFFTTFNNFLGGVFMSLMDPYGLSLVSLEVWGFIWGALSFGFIFGGLFIARKGLGKKPLRTLFLVNIIMWTTCIFFTIQPSIILLVTGMALWMTLMPFVEASEQTIIQKVVPPERLGRVFGFAQSTEQAASPLTAFLIGPIAQFFFIPFMTTGAGVELIGDWFGVGPGRGIALVFTAAGIIGLIVTLFAMRSTAYKVLSKKYADS